MFVCVCVCVCVACVSCVFFLSLSLGEHNAEALLVEESSHLDTKCPRTRQNSQSQPVCMTVVVAFKRKREATEITNGIKHSHL